MPAGPAQLLISCFFYDSSGVYRCVGSLSASYTRRIYLEEWCGRGGVRVGCVVWFLSLRGRVRFANVGGGRTENECAYIPMKYYIAIPRPRFCFWFL